jgi:muconolactone delta-isomerase
MKYTVQVTVEFEGELEVDAVDSDQARSLAESAVQELLEAEGTVFEPYRRPTEIIGMGPGIEKHYVISLTAIDGRIDQ